MTSDAEAELQQELRTMFEVDTQQYLQDYFNLVQQLNRRSWATDIQHIYRAVHTIKGGAVTVGADAVLQAGKVLEDLLSDLRFLEQAPDLADGHLSQMLLEAGELLSSSIEIKALGAAATTQVQPAIQRITDLHQLIRQRYLPDWNDLKQVHQEFAEQGFDLVVLALEMTLNQLSPPQPIPLGCLQTARQTLDQLAQIGRDLEFSADWTVLLAECQTLVDQADSAQWQASWPPYFQLLKACARQGGELSLQLQAQLDAIRGGASAPTLIHHSAEPETSVTPPPTAALDSLWMSAALPDLELPDLELPDLAPEERLPLPDLPPESLLQAGTTDPIAAELLEGLDDWQLDDLMPQHPDADIAASPWMPDEPIFNDGTDDFALFADEPSFDDAAANFAVFDAVEPDLLTLDGLETALAVEIPEPTVDAPSVLPATAVNTKRSVQISVPLERLDQAAQQVVETLLSARGVVSISDKLQTQLTQITALSQESAQFITRLRQLQDDYALLHTLSDEQDDPGSVPLERYRQGYTTINRLLENVLRMAELGQEITAVSQQTSSRLDKLDRSMLRLKDSIEHSRLVSFRNLGLRARAIVRDLSNRYGKPVELVLQGEQVELDAGVLQQIEPALLHLLRNAYDHGIEPVETRLAQGKPPQGTIQLSLHRRGNLYRLAIKDDGGGINAQAIAQLAKIKGFALYQTRTDAELLAVLCQPGFSSRSAVTDVSGRGVGMDVVAAQIASMKGKLSLETHPGIGTTFTIEVPAPQLLVPCVLLEVGERILALPTDEILETTLINPTQISPWTANHPLLTWSLQTSRGPCPCFDLANYWLQAERSLDLSTPRALADTAIAIRARSTKADQTDLWLIADDLLGQAELLINPLPDPLVTPAGLLGVSLQPDGRLITVLDPSSLSTTLQSAPPAKLTQPSQAAAPVPRQSTAIKVLVVDDAALMRRRIEGSLNTHGFATFTCADGLEAWTWLQANGCPDLMITDVEMPNMDGFTLIDRCRQSGMNLPILVVSSRLSEEWGKEAHRLGANDYLNKGFSTPELLSKVNQLLVVPA